jgi:hypothetical protein
MGFKQRGGSRFWYRDVGWRLFIVAFEPSSWSKGTHCNATVMWLWAPYEPPFWAFHVLKRVSGPRGLFATYDGNEESFETKVS